MEAYLRDLAGDFGQTRTAVPVLHEHIEKIVIHPVRTEAAKPFARAEY